MPHVSLAARAADVGQRMLALDEQQLQILDAASENARAVVRGGAGSGKTVVARELCLRRARQGQRVLYACFTDALVLAVDRWFEPARRAGQDVRAVAIRRFAGALVSPDHQAPRAADPQFWELVSLQAACDALPAQRPDLVVVDEGQDLSEADWSLVETLAQGRGLWVFADEHQRFWSERALPPSLEALPRLRLPAQHRSPPGLAAFAARYAGGGPDGRLVGGGDVRVVVAPARDVLDRVRHEVETLLREKVRPADIAVLSLAGVERSALLKRASLGKVPLARADAPEAADRVVADTFLRFKGLERPFVVVTELVHGPKMQYETRMHIALTRATAGAIVVCDEEAVGRDERLGGLVARGRLGA